MFNWNTHTPLTLDEISEADQQALLEKVANQIVKRRMTVPAILFLEICKPLNFLGSQILIGFNPFLQSIVNTSKLQKFALIIEKDANVELLIRLIEEVLDRQKEALGLSENQLFTDFASTSAAVAQ